MVGRNFAWVCKASGLHHFLQGMQSLLVKVKHAVSLGGHVQGFLAVRVLRGHACRAIASVARLGLNATQRKHKATGRIAPVCAQRHHAGNVKSADHFTSAA